MRKEHAKTLAVIPKVHAVSGIFMQAVRISKKIFCLIAVGLAEMSAMSDVIDRQYTLAETMIICFIWVTILEEICHQLRGGYPGA